MAGFEAPNDTWRRMAYSTEDNSLKIRDVTTGQEILAVNGHTILVRHLAFSPDGKRLASGAGGMRWSTGFAVSREDQPEVKLWDAKTGRELFAFPMPSGAVWAMKFSPDGTRLAAVSMAPAHPDTVTLKVWDVDTGRELVLLQGETGLITSLAYSPDGTHLACSHKVLDAETGQELFTVRGGGYGYVTFTPDGKHLVTSSAAGLKFWNAKTGAEVQTLTGGRTGGNFVFSPDGKRIATLITDGDVLIRDAKTGLELFLLESNSDDSFRTQSLAFNPDGHRLACSGAGGTLRIYDATPLPETP